jgi:acyl-CoA reductase-like NAD-dependent aldehyde dehydrogenase
VFTGVRNDMALAQEEIFGPVLGVIPFSDDAEGVRIANDTRFGLAAGIWTRSLSRAHLLARELRCGNIWVNTYRASAAQAPFGGTKQSGYGRERGLEALTYYTRVKNTMIELSDHTRDPFKLET